MTNYFLTCILSQNQPQDSLLICTVTALESFSLQIPFATSRMVPSKNKVTYLPEERRSLTEKEVLILYIST